MKWLFYFKVLGLILNFSIGAVLAMEQEESSHITPTSKHTLATLEAICVKNIKREIRKDPFFAFNEAERFKKKLLDETQKSKDTPRFKEEAIDEVLASCQLIPGQQKEDPPFFLLKNGEKEIYILGSQHTIPVYRCLDFPTLTELRRISELKPIFYMEHESTNKQALTLLQQPENQVGPQFISMGFDLLFQLGLTLKEEGSEFNKYCEGKSFSLDMAEESNIEILEVVKAKLWLGAMLLGSQANILSYQKFGGLESELMYGPFWEACWRERRFLETDKEILDIQKKYDKDGKDYAQNISWALKSIGSIVRFMKSDEETLEDINSKIWAQKLKKYSWNIINYPDRTEIPESVIERQTLWAQRLLEPISEEEDFCPLLIVIGEGHLPGYSQGWSFLSLLNNELKWPLLRFSNKDGWVQVN